MNIKQYRKKPVVIEALLVTSPTADRAAEWCKGKVTQLNTGEKVVDIKTLEGTMRASHGAYIIKGVQGEFYPCRADIFAQTYEEVENAA